MSDFLTLDVTVSERSISAPPIDLSFDTVTLPTIGPYSVGGIDFDGAFYNLPDLYVPPLPVPYPDLSVGSEERTISVPVPFPTADFTPPDLEIETKSFRIPVAGVTIDIVDPLRSSLDGGNVGLDLNWQSFGRTVDVPDPSLSIGKRYITGSSLDPFNFGSDVFTSNPSNDPILNTPLPTISIPPIRNDGLSIPEFDLPSFGYVDGVSLAGSVTVPDPAGISVDASLDIDGLADYVLDPIPSDFLANPTQWAFFAVLDETANHITETVAQALREITEGFFDLLMESETKERLREQNRDN
jgi:hypothetical protein